MKTLLAVVIGGMISALTSYFVQRKQAEQSIALQGGAV